LDDESEGAWEVRSPKAVAECGCHQEQARDDEETANDFRAGGVAPVPNPDEDAPADK
jgi:hypothetical protein